MSRSHWANWKKPESTDLEPTTENIVHALEWKARQPPPPPATHTVPLYGCKPFGHETTCHDVHPCPACDRGATLVEWTETVRCPDCPGLDCSICHGVGEVLIPRSCWATCDVCDGAGVGPIPAGSACYCECCSRHGMDGRHPAVPTDVQPLPRDPEPVPPQTPKFKPKLPRKKRGARSDLSEVLCA